MNVERRHSFTMRVQKIFILLHNFKVNTTGQLIEKIQTINIKTQLYVEDVELIVFLYFSESTIYMQ